MYLKNTRYRPKTKQARRQTTIDVRNYNGERKCEMLVDVVEKVGWGGVGWGGEVVQCVGGLDRMLTVAADI